MASPMDNKMKNGVALLLILVNAIALPGCTGRDGANASEDQLTPNPLGVAMHDAPPLSLAIPEKAIEEMCKVDLRNWSRRYSYRWMPTERAFSKQDLSFVLRKGPYPDLGPSREWKDIREVVQIDDRPGILSVFGHYNIKSRKLTFEVGDCFALR